MNLTDDNIHDILIILFSTLLVLFLYSITDNLSLIAFILFLIVVSLILLPSPDAAKESKNMKASRLHSLFYPSKIKK